MKYFQDKFDSITLYIVVFCMGDISRSLSCQFTLQITRIPYIFS